MLCNVPNPSLGHGSCRRDIGKRAHSGTYPAEVIKDNYASRGRAFVNVPSHATNRVALGVCVPYPPGDPS
eukprot:10105347-Prorocentrum_lima.AAC.1